MYFFGAFVVVVQLATNPSNKQQQPSGMSRQSVLVIIKYIVLSRYFSIPKATDQPREQRAKLHGFTLKSKRHFPTADGAFCTEQHVTPDADSKKRALVNLSTKARVYSNRRPRLNGQ